MITKQAVDISFAQGLDTKTDPKRVTMGKFLSLVNTVFTKSGLLQKRNGFSLVGTISTLFKYLSTFKGGLVAIGEGIAGLNTADKTFIYRGYIEPINLDTIPLIRNNFPQIGADSATAPNGLVLVAYQEDRNGTVFNLWAVVNDTTGQLVVTPRPIPVTTGTVIGGMRVVYCSGWFNVFYTELIAGNYALKAFQCTEDGETSFNPVTIEPNYVYTSPGVSFDAIAEGSFMWVMYPTGPGVAVKRLNPGLSPVNSLLFAGYTATLSSLTFDTTPALVSNVLWATWINPGAGTGFTVAIDDGSATPLGVPMSITAGNPYTAQVVNLTTAAIYIPASLAHDLFIFTEVTNSYSWGGASNFVTFQVANTGAVGSASISCRSIGLGSKAFIMNGFPYYFGAYQSAYQSTYFLVNGNNSLAPNPSIVGKLAYSNGGGYYYVPPSVTLNGTKAQVPYLYKDLIAAVNKNTNVPSGNQVAGVYSQTGINLSTWDFSTNNICTVDLGNDLNIGGGITWSYDGYVPVEQNFFLWPDVSPSNPPAPDNTDIAKWSMTYPGNIAAGGAGTQPFYFYQFTYEWTDNQGNAVRSAPSIPIAVVTPGGAGTGAIELNIPTLRVTMKTNTPVKICIYRWSQAQQVYYEVTSITNPVLNRTDVDAVFYVDTTADADILGNTILYTTGGVVENVAPPATNIMSIFDTRLWIVNSEDKNQLWFSKQVIEATPVEMSDLFTVYIPPTTGLNSSTGPITALQAMDDKLIIFKESAIYYLNGAGPDNTGANNQYSQAIFVTSTVGCTNQNSIVLMPSGLMFQSNKGIWLLDRGLQTTYIGSPVEEFNTSLVNSAVNVANENQVRFTLSTGQTLMYDYFYGQWGTFSTSAISSTFYQGLHTIINSAGQVLQEAPGTYVDNGNAVLMSFKTGPLRLGDLQNYQRAYFFYLLGTFLSPHKLFCSIYYDYQDWPEQTTLISPDNYSTPYGSGTSQDPYGQGLTYGGQTNLEVWRVFLARQRCMAFALQVQEIYDPSFGVAPGAGLTLSGINVVMGFKKGFRPQPNVHTAG